MNRYHRSHHAVTRVYINSMPLEYIHEIASSCSSLTYRDARLHLAAMKFAVVSCLLAVVAVTYVSARPDGDGEYTHKYDNIDVDQILHNDRLFNRYADCLLERSKGRCPPETVELKKILSEALETECAKCSDRQKETAKKVIRFLVENKRDIWTDLKKKYDPEGKYTQRYEDMARKEGVQI